MTPDQDGADGLTVTTLAERPHLLDAFYDLGTTWPEFMTHDPTGNEFYARAEVFADFILVATAADDSLVARVCSIPFRLDGAPLPDEGWDGAIRKGIRCRDLGETPDTVSAIEIAIAEGSQGQGLSSVLLEAMRANVRRHGIRRFVAPVRPTGRTDVHQPMADYARRTRDDGLPVDPWLRVHVRAGGTIEKVAPTSMVIAADVERWRQWTGLPFDADGPVEVPGALVPVTCDVTHGVASYVEPNVWVRHRV